MAKAPTDDQAKDKPAAAAGADQARALEYQPAQKLVLQRRERDEHT